jgi:hypothetical protein
MSNTPPDAGQPMPKEEWDRHATRVTNEMKEFTKKFVTPISRAIDHDHGEPWGTGNYIELNKRPGLLTNEHVAVALKSNSLAHQFLGADTLFRATQPFHAFGVPLDVAVSPIEDKVWTVEQHQSAVIPEEKWALAHAPVKDEILFFKGIKGARVPFAFGTLFTNATLYGCVEVPLPTDDRFHSRFHFGLDYRPDGATPLDGRDLPLPDGFSGSLVWNTRFVECWQKNERWSVDQAQVTGLVWGWPSGAACLVVTRIEYVRSFLLRVIVG